MIQLSSRKWGGRGLAVCSEVFIGDVQPPREVAFNDTLHRADVLENSQSASSPLRNACPPSSRIVGKLGVWLSRMVLTELPVSWWEKRAQKIIFSFKEIYFFFLVYIDLFVGGFGTRLHRARLPANNLEEGKRGSQIPYSKDTESTHQQCPKHHKKHMTLGHAYN